MLKHRETKQRRIVLETVRCHTDHPTANTIYEEVHAIDGKISQGTVYRNLSCLSEDGEILHIKVPGADRYDLRTDLHYHIICLKCGKVIDIPFPIRMKRLQMRPVTRYFVTEPCSRESARNVKRKTIYNPKADKERMWQYMHWKKAAQALLLAVGTVMLCAGALRGEAATVLSKAIRLCLESVGIG